MATTLTLWCPFPDCRKPIKIEFDTPPADEEVEDDDCPHCENELRFTYIRLPGTGALMGDASPKPPED